MFGLFLLLLIVVPIIELYVLFQVADGLGWGWSLLLMLGVSLLGGLLMRVQATGAWTSVITKLSRAKLPSDELVDGALMIFGGALMLTPGFFTDAVGIAMYIPPIRILVRTAILARLTVHVTAVSKNFQARVFTRFVDPDLDDDIIDVNESKKSSSGSQARTGQPSNSASQKPSEK